jgi:hypothetical protein
MSRLRALREAIVGKNRLHSRSQRHSQTERQSIRNSHSIFLFKTGRLFQKIIMFFGARQKSPAPLIFHSLTFCAGGALVSQRRTRILVEGTLRTRVLIGLRRPLANVVAWVSCVARVARVNTLVAHQHLAVGAAHTPCRRSVKASETVGSASDHAGLRD